MCSLRTRVSHARHGVAKHECREPSGLLYFRMDNRMASSTYVDWLHHDTRTRPLGRSAGGFGRWDRVLHSVMDSKNAECQKINPATRKSYATEMKCDWQKPRPRSKCCITTIQSKKLPQNNRAPLCLYNLTEALLPVVMSVLWTERTTG